MNPDEVGIFSVEKNRLPFEGGEKFKIIKNATYEHIEAAFRNPKLKQYVIDDSTYLMINQIFDRIKETGYTKFSDIAKKFRDIIHDVNKKLPDDVIVYYLHHLESVPNTGKLKAKTAGKMLDDVLDIPSCFDIVLMAETENNGKDHYFVTQTDGFTPAKSPENMFELKIENDLSFVDKRIREYYGFNKKEEN